MSRFVLYLALLVGVAACALSVILIRLSATEPALLSGYRLLIATVLLSPLYFIERRRWAGRFRMLELRRTIPAAIALALHFLSWTFGARATVAVNATLIVNLVPLATPFLLMALAGERVNRSEVVGTCVSLGGVLLLTAGDLSFGARNAMGDLICLVSMLLFAWYLVLGRRNRDFPSLWLYLVPLYGLAGVVCLVGSALAGHPPVALTGREFLLMIGLALVPTICGHSLLNFAMRHLRGQVVAIGSLFQFLFAGTFAFLFFGEVPVPLFYVASLLVVSGAVVALRGRVRVSGVTLPGSGRSVVGGP